MRESHADGVDLLAVALDDALLDVLAVDEGGRWGSSARGGYEGAGHEGAGHERTGHEWTGPGGAALAGDGHGPGRIAGSPVDRGVPAEDDRLPRMLAAWRDELRLRPLPSRPCSAAASRLVAQSRRHRSSRPVIAVAASIVALLVGSAIVGSRTAEPGDALFPVTQALWADRADAAVAGEQVRGALDQARSALQDGNARRAADALATAVNSLHGVRDLQTHLAMEREIVHLWGMVAAADPAAVTPGTEPGVPGGTFPTGGGPASEPAAGGDGPAGGGSGGAGAGGAGGAGSGTRGGQPSDRSGDQSGSASAGTSSTGASPGGQGSGGAGEGPVTGSSGADRPPYSGPATSAPGVPGTGSPGSSGPDATSGGTSPSTPAASAPPSGGQTVPPTTSVSAGPATTPSPTGGASTSPGAPATTASAQPNAASTSSTSSGAIDPPAGPAPTATTGVPDQPANQTASWFGAAMFVLPSTGPGQPTTTADAGAIGSTDIGPTAGVAGTDTTSGG
jgi:hypothetical protein